MAERPIIGHRRGCPTLTEPPHHGCHVADDGTIEVLHPWQVGRLYLWQPPSMGMSEHTVELVVQNECPEQLAAHCSCGWKSPTATNTGRLDQYIMTHTPEPGQSARNVVNIVRQWPQLTWKAGRPTEPGWYWLKVQQQVSRPATFGVAHVYRDAADGALWINWPFQDIDSPLFGSFVSQFAGPIDEPVA